jgi:hypothetical protein
VNEWQCFFHYLNLTKIRSAVENLKGDFGQGHKVRKLSISFLFRPYLLEVSMGTCPFENCSRSLGSCPFVSFRPSFRCVLQLGLVPYLETCSHSLGICLFLSIWPSFRHIPQLGLVLYLETCCHFPWDLFLP